MLSYRARRASWRAEALALRWGVDEPQSLDGELAQGIFVEMIRAGVLRSDMLDRVEQDFRGKARAYAGSSREDRYETLADMIVELQMFANAQTASDWRAEQARKEIKRRTAYIARQTDGGNSD